MRKNQKKNPQKQKKLGLSLRGGMARCTGYFGVLKALEEEGIEIDAIVGSSMGAMIGTMYATGMFTISEMIEIGRSMHLKKMIGLESLSDLAILGDSFTEEMFAHYIGDMDLKDLPMKNWVQVTNLDKKKGEFRSKGPIKKIVLASIAFPFLIKPVIYEGETLIDGDLTASYGVDYLREHDAEVILALEPGENSVKANHESLASRIIEPMILGGQILRRKELKNSPPDMLISDIGKDVKFYEFERIDELVELGYNEMKKNMSKLTELLYS